MGKLHPSASAVVLHIPVPSLPTDAPSCLSDTPWRVCQHSSSHQTPSDLLNIVLDRSQGPSDITGQVFRPAHLLSCRSRRKFQAPSPFLASQETLQIFRKLGPTWVWAVLFSYLLGLAGVLPLRQLSRYGVPPLIDRPTDTRLNVVMWVAECGFPSRDCDILGKICASHPLMFTWIVLHSASGHGIDLSRED